MKKLIALVCLCVAFAVSAPAFAGTQQNKMKSCNKDAKGKGFMGDERKAFMKDCLGKKSGTSTGKKTGAPKGQNAKMK